VYLVQGPLAKKAEYVFNYLIKLQTVLRKQIKSGRHYKDKFVRKEFQSDRIQNSPLFKRNVQVH